MTYNCDITPEDGKFFVKFPDVLNAITFGFTHEDALYMAQDVLNAILITHVEDGYPIAEPKYKGGAIR